MAETRKGLRFQDFEKLLCEIPKTTSGYPCTESKRISFGDGLSPVLVESCKGQPYSSKGPYSEKLPSNGIFHERKTSVDEVDDVSLVNEVRLPDEQSMASAFADLKIENGLAREAMSLPLANDGTVHNIPLCLDSNDLKIHSLTAHSQWNNVYPPESKMMASTCFDQFSGAKCGQRHPELLKYDSESLKNRQVGGFQPLGSSNALMPITNGVQLLHNVHVPAVEFPVMPNEKQYCISTPSSFPYFHRPHRNECQIFWRNEEEEKPYQLYRQNLHILQNCDYQLEAKHPVHVSANFASSLMHQYPRIQHNQVPVSHQFGQFEEGTFCHNHGNTRCLKKINLGLSSADVYDAQVLERTMQASCPEKILTSSHNLNSLRGVKFGSVAGNESVNHVAQDGRHTLNGQHHHCIWSPTARCSSADGFDPWLLSSDATYIKSCDSRLLSQKSIGVDEARGRIHLMAKDQHGCRLLQRKISEGPQEAVEKIFFEVIGSIVELMTDPFGNYLVQKLLEVCNEDQQTQMLQEITRKPGDLVRISCDMHGTRAVQKVIETLKTADHISIVVNSLKPCIVTLMKNMNGNHVAQRCLQFLIPAYTQFLFEAAAANCVELATDRHGCCVLQKCLSHSGGEHRQHLISEIISNALILSQDQFGNYVVQFIFELQVPQAIRILDQLEGKYGDLSMQKYSSNVVEKCLKHSGEEGRKRIIQEVIDDPRLDQIMQDAYGNYVIQAALNLSEGALEDALVEAIKPHIPVLRTSPYGKKVLSSSNRLKKQSPQV